MTSSRSSLRSSRSSDGSKTLSNPNSSVPTPTTPHCPKEEPSIDINRFHDQEEVKNAEDDLEEPVPGWPKVALLMAQTPDFASFSRFRDLNIKSLLYYQAELTSLRKELHKQEWRDYRLGEEDKEQRYCSRADMLADCLNIEDEGKPSKQWTLVLRLRTLLKEYNEALLQFSQISALPEPDDCNMRTLRTWLRESEAGDFCIGGQGEESTWGDIFERDNEEPVSLKRQFRNMMWRLLWPKSPSSETEGLDLVATRPRRKIDGFTRWVANDFVPFHNDFTKRRQTGMNKQTKGDPEKAHRHKAKKKPKNEGRRQLQKKTLSIYSENSMLKFTSSVSTVVACLLPTIAITVLSKVNGLNNLLLCLAGFATVFSIGLIFLTNATTSRVEIFTATAAFSAVLVVFIQQPVVKVIDLA